MANEQATAFPTLTAGDPAVAEVARRLVEAYRPERVCLFHSVAAGSAQIPLVKPRSAQKARASLEYANPAREFFRLH